MPYRLGLLITRHGAIERDLEQESLIGYVWEWVARGNRVLHPGCMAPWAKSLIDLGSWIAQSRVIVPEQTEWSSDGCTFHLVQIKWQRLLLMEMLRNWLVCAATNSRKHTHTHSIGLWNGYTQDDFQDSYCLFSLYQLTTTHAKYTAHIAQLTCIQWRSTWYGNVWPLPYLEFCEVPSPLFHLCFVLYFSTNRLMENRNVALL